MTNYKPSGIVGAMYQVYQFGKPHGISMYSSGLCFWEVPVFGVPVPTAHPPGHVASETITSNQCRLKVGDRLLYLGHSNHKIWKADCDFAVCHEYFLFGAKIITFLYPHFTYESWDCLVPINH